MRAREGLDTEVRKMSPVKAKEHHTGKFEGETTWLQLEAFVVRSKRKHSTVTVSGEANQGPLESGRNHGKHLHRKWRGEINIWGKINLATKWTSEGKAY